MWTPEDIQDGLPLLETDASFLERLLWRLTVQRDVLDRVSRELRGREGLRILELGLGSGRTYDHLRRLFPEAEIFTFDDRIDLREEYRPPPDRIVIGPIAETLPRFLKTTGRKFDLIHVDIGTGKIRENIEFYKRLQPELGLASAPGAWIASDRPIRSGSWQRVDVSEWTRSWPYFLYRAE